MIYPYAVIPLVAEPIHRGRNDRNCHRGHFCCAKAGVYRRKSVMHLWLLTNHHALLLFCSPNTACGHGDFCSVRLNGPIWGFILTHRYRLSLSHFTEAVMIKTATGTTFAAQKQESTDAKVLCTSSCCRIIIFYRYSPPLIQPTVMATFALSDLMALFEGLYLRRNTACRWANSQRPLL